MSKFFRFLESQFSFGKNPEPSANPVETPRSSERPTKQAIQERAKAAIKKWSSEPGSVKDVYGEIVKAQFPGEYEDFMAYYTDFYPGWQKEDFKEYADALLEEARARGVEYIKLGIEK